MNDHPNADSLQRLLDGDVAYRERSEISEHLQNCAACRERFDRLRALVEELALLPTMIEPTVDPWPGIEARIHQAPPDARARPGFEPPSARRTRWPIRRNVILATAAALIIGVALGRQMIARPGTATSSAPEPNAATLLASYDQPAYDRAVSELEAILNQRRDELKPETVEALEENLAIIDQAIADAREALRADPANQYLNQHLSSTMQTKLQLLRTIIEI